MSNRGTEVWPDSMRKPSHRHLPLPFRVRRRGGIAHAQIADMLQKVVAAGYDIVKTETLRNFDGNAAIRSHRASKRSSREPPTLVAIIMGSKSDWETMRAAERILTRFDVPHESPRRFGASHAGLDGRIRVGRGRRAESRSSSPERAARRICRA